MFSATSTGRRVAALATFSLLACSCYGKQLSQLEVRTARMEDKLASLERMNRDLSTNVDSVQRLVAEEVELARAGRAGNEQRLHEIQQLLSVLDTRVDESGQRYRELKDEVKYSKPPGDSAGATGGATPRSLYDAAYQDLTRGNHGLAIMGFQEVLAKFPDSELADNAQYWIGESYYAQKDYKQALKEFGKAVDTYPKGDKVPAAMLKAAMCQQQLGDKKSAKSTLQKLISGYPNSEEARLANTKLQEL
jgi:tol-pal system protein YbgF